MFDGSIKYLSNPIVAGFKSDQIRIWDKLICFTPRFFQKNMCSIPELPRVASRPPQSRWSQCHWWHPSWLHGARNAHQGRFFWNWIMSCYPRLAPSSDTYYSYYTNDYTIYYILCNGIWCPPKKICQWFRMVSEHFDDGSTSQWYYVLWEPTKKIMKTNSNMDPSCIAMNSNL